MLRATTLIVGFAVFVSAQSATDSTGALSPTASSSTPATDFVALSRDVFPSVVTVRSYARVRDRVVSSDQAAEGWGGASPNEVYPGFVQVLAMSGFVVNAARRDILTCAHGVQTSDGSLPELTDVEFQDGSRALVAVVAVEPTVNLALLRCEVFPSGAAPRLEALEFGASDLLQSGECTVGFGDPAGPEKFLAPGWFVARPSRDCYQELLSAFYVQVSMVVPPEAYGGPLVDRSGKVVGVLSPRRPRPGSAVEDPKTGVEFALPSKIVSGLYETLQQVRSFRSPWLGFSVMSRAEIAAVRGVPAFDAMKKPRQGGVLIEGVFQPSPASRSGLLAGDFLVSLDGQRIFAPVDFQRYLYLAGVGRTVRLEVFRGGETILKDIIIEARPATAHPR